MLWTSSGVKATMQVAVDDGDAYETLVMGAAADTLCVVGEPRCTTLMLRPANNSCQLVHRISLLLAWQMCTTAGVAHARLSLVRWAPSAMIWQSESQPRPQSSVDPCVPSPPTVWPAVELTEWR